jgi:hypothetical protein
MCAKIAGAPFKAKLGAKNGVPARELKQRDIQNGRT